MYTKGRRSLVAARRIEAGEVIRSDAITAKRPGFGVQPRFLNALIGRTARKTIEEDDVITWEML
jgi:sialic acid synthase SpsE